MTMNTSVLLADDGEVRRQVSTRVRHQFTDCDPADFRRPRNLVCITLYNEPVAEFVATLRALLISLQSCGARMRHGDAAPSAIFIVADGADRLDPAIHALLVRLGLLPVAGCGAETVFHHSLHAAATVLAAFDDAPLDFLPMEQRIRFTVCVKPRNRGKLDSHALFFGELCRELNPVYCHQLDVGTVVAPDAVRALVDQMDASPCAGGIASRVSVAPPAPLSGLLETWQYLDFATQLAVGWPGEVAAGHLSVLPGQYCVVRWMALQSERETGPLRRYLRGARSGSTMDRLMFLAEDRVLGNELVVAPGERWKLDYCPGAAATTDRCVTLSELLQQRRRWNNGSLTGRLWMLRQWRRELTRADRTLREKASFSFAMVWQVMIIVQQLIMPALAISSGAVLVAALSLLNRGWTVTTIAAAAISWALVLTPRRRRAGAIIRDVVSVGNFALIALVLTLAFGWGAAALLTGPAIASALLTASAIRSDGGAILRRSAEYWGVNPWMQTLLSCYAIARLNDLSWGTKGLTAHTGRAGGSDRDRRRMRQVRDAAFCGWIALNAGVAWVAVSTPGLLFRGLNPVLEGSSLLAITLTLPASIMFFARRRWASRRAGGSAAGAGAPSPPLSECLAE